jgi:outer membrane protein assembly factor BamE (lipoprotein component of BamABCDE complex)
MNRRLALILIVLVACLAGCVATGPNSAALRVGMTRDEAVAAMGQPGSVAANGHDEYLNYTITETSPDGYHSIMRPYYVRLFDGHVQSFGYSEQINRRLSPPTPAAENANRFAALRIGMTKEEAVKAMGTPTSVAAQGNYEYLNYSVTEANPYGSLTVMRPYYIRLLDGKVEAFGLADQVGRALPAPRVPAPVTTPYDDVQVLSIEPATLAPGKAQSVTVKVKYSVQTRSKAVVVLLFNLSEAAHFKPVNEEVVSSGTGEISLQATITPVDWAQAGAFAVSLHLLDYPHIKGQFSKPIISTVGVPVPLAKPL